MGTIIEIYNAVGALIKAMRGNSGLRVCRRNDKIRNAHRPSHAASVTAIYIIYQRTGTGGENSSLMAD